MSIKKIEKNTNIDALKEDSRKIGVNFITAGTAALFLSHTIHPTLWMWFGAFWIILMGTFALYLGIKNGRNE